MNPTEPLAVCKKRQLFVHVDRLRGLSDLELNVQLDLVRNSKDDARLLVGPEAGLLDAQGILSRRQTEQMIFPALVAGRLKFRRCGQFVG